MTYVERAARYPNAGGESVEHDMSEPGKSAEPLLTPINLLDERDIRGLRAWALQTVQRKREPWKGNQRAEAHRAALVLLVCQDRERLRAELAEAKAIRNATSYGPIIRA